MPEIKQVDHTVFDPTQTEWEFDSGIVKDVIKEKEEELERTRIDLAFYQSQMRKKYVSGQALRELQDKVTELEQYIEFLEDYL